MNKPHELHQKDRERILYYLAVSIMIVLALDGMIQVGRFTGFASLQSEAGSITELDIQYRPSVTVWAGLYGIAVRYTGFTFNQTESLSGGEMAERNLLFDCLPSNYVNEVFASHADPNNIEWSSLAPADISDIDAYMGVTADNFQSATNTFTNTIWALIGTRNVTDIPATYTYVYDKQKNLTTFDIGALVDQNGNMVFVAHITQNFSYGFNNKIYNFQMILPIRNGTDQEYYFSADPNNRCPEGIGELPITGFVTGIVTDENGNTIENAIVEVAGTVDLTNAQGNYSIEPASGEHNIYAVKTGYKVYVSNLTVPENATVIHNIIMELLPVDQEEHLYDFPESQTAAPDDLTGRYNIRPILEEPKRIEGTDYIISLSEIKRKLRVGNYLQEQVFIISYKKSTASVYFEVEGDVASLIKLDKENLFINPNSKEEITLTIFGKGDPGIYNGTLKITGDLNATIPIEIELLSKDQLPVEALMIELDTPKKSVKAGDTFKFTTDLRNMLTDQEYPVELFYTIQSSDGNTTIWTYSTNIFLRTGVSLVKEIRIPKTAKDGDYIISVTANYLGLSSSTSTIFAIVVPFWKVMLFGRIPLWWIFAFIAFILGVAIAYIFIRRNIESKKKFHLKVDYNELPKPGPRSIFVGKIAETDHKTYMNIENFKTHTIVAGSTGGGKSFSAQGIIEEMLLKDVAILCFDPTAQWTGMLRKQNSKFLLDLYADFGMKKEEARAFNGNIKQVMDKREIIDIKKYMKPGEIMVFACHKLDPKDMDTFVANVIREVFHANFDESPRLRLMLVFDEVHRLLPKFGGSGDGFLQIERGCREFRKWGIGILLISQFLADFMGQIKANINTEIQMRTRDEGDLERIRVKYGEEVLRSLVKATVGAGMVENPAYNRGQPYFVQFRPLLHSVERLSDEEVEKYTKFNNEVDNLLYSLEQLEKEGVDVFDLKLELKLAQDKIKTGNFNMVEIYLEGLRPRISKYWEKLGKQPKKYEIKMASEDSLKEAMALAKKSREDYLKTQAKPTEATGGKEKPKDPAALFKTDVPPEKILNLANGMIVINLNSLFDELSAMKKDDFEKDVNYDQNKIAAWVMDAVGDAELASHIENILDKKEMVGIIEMRKKGGTLPPIKPKPPKPVEEKKEEGVKKEGDNAKAPIATASGTLPGTTEKADEQKIGEAAGKPEEKQPESKTGEKLAPFKLKNGKEISSIDDLVSTVKSMSEEEFKEYVNESKNEFYSWAKDIAKDDALATKIHDIHSRNDLLEALA
ncbi:MAG: DUF87 domain-containing protein [Nanoarchaeota archaeon]